RIGPAEAVRQLLAELGPVGAAHDHRRELRRPAEIVAVERLEEAFDVLAREAATVALLVDVPRRRPDEHELPEPVGLANGREDADHRAHGMPDEDDVPELELATDVEHVARIPVQ